MKLSDLTSSLSVKLQLLDKTAEDKDTPVSFVMLDRKGNAIETMVERDGGEMKLDPNVLREAASVALLPGDGEVSAESIRAATKFTPSQFTDLVQPTGELTIPTDVWKPLFPFTTCLSGKVRKCAWWPFFLRFQTDRNVLQGPVEQFKLQAGDPFGAVLKAEVNPIWDLPILPPLQPLCRPICNARVEIFRRTCCYRFELHPTDIIDICERLKGIIERLPEIPRIPPIGPIPEPDPLPFRQAGIFSGGAVDELARNAERDLAILQSSSPDLAQAHILKTPYLARLVYDCSEPIRVAEGEVGRDGKFSICFRDFPIVLREGCKVEYAFIVTQRIRGSDVVIYNGLAANAWFDAKEDICLSTYLPEAHDCEDLPPDHTHGEPDVFLSQIGATDAWHIHRHGQDTTLPGVNPVTVLGAKTGLVGGSGHEGATAPVPYWLDAPWGGTLQLKYFFPDALKATGARYYRIGVRPISDAGVPSGSPDYLSDAITWKYDDGISQEHAFPLNFEGNPEFYRIPYDDHDWIGTQIHGLLDTTRTEANLHHHGKFLIELELYLAAGDGSPGARIVPNESLDNSGGHATGAFQFAFRQPAGDRETQPFNALSTVLWWDNRPAVATIEGFIPAGDDPLCQFIEAPVSDTLQCIITADHAVDAFLWDWRMDYTKGKTGTRPEFAKGTSVIEMPTAVPASGAMTFGELLGVSPKCAFAFNLRARVRTWSGSSQLRHLDGVDQAAVALLKPAAAAVAP